MNSCHYRVCYGDTDQMGVVYYANYLRMFEFGRAAYLRAIALPYTETEATGMIWPVAEANVRYLRSAHYDDLLDIDVALVKLGQVSADFIYQVRRDEVLLATGSTRLASIDRQGRKMRIPPDMRARFVVDPKDVFAREAGAQK